MGLAAPVSPITQNFVGFGIVVTARGTGCSVYTATNTKNSGAGIFWKAAEVTGSRITDALPIGHRRMVPNE